MGSDNERLEDLVEHCQCLKKLSITVSCPMKKERLIKKLFPRNSNSKYFNSNGRLLYPTNDKVYTYSNLTYLSIELGRTHELFILLHRLPNLEILKVRSF
jgi:hypothetical protein